MTIILFLLAISFVLLSDAAAEHRLLRQLNNLHVWSLAALMTLKLLFDQLNKNISDEFLMNESTSANILQLILLKETY